MAESQEKIQNTSTFNKNIIKSVVTILNTPVPLPFIRQRLRTSDLMDLSAKLAAMTEAGLPIARCLRLLADEANSPWLKDHIDLVAEHVEKGFSLSDSFKLKRTIFPSIFINMVQAGDASGRLDTAFHRLTLHFEKQHNLEQKVKSATVYPKFIAGVLILVVVFLFVFVVPSFQGVFQGLGTELPLMTRIILLLGDFFAHHVYFFIGLLLFLYIVAQFIFKTEKGIYSKDKFLLLVPYYRDFYIKLLVARFCRTLGTMLGSGIDVLLALELASKVTDNRVFESSLIESKTHIVNGETIAESLYKTGLFPPMVIGLVNTGEQTGTLEKMLERTALFYEQDVEHALNRMSSILEPILILLMAFIVGVVVISVLLPMFELFTYF